MKTITSLGTFLLMIAVLGCQPGGNEVRYPQVRTESAGDRQVLSAGTQLIDATDGSWKGSRRMSGGRDNELGVMLFDLGKIPAGSSVSGATLRVRRVKATGAPAVSAFPVKKALQVLFFGDGEPLFGITRARLTMDKAEMFSEARRLQDNEYESSLKDDQVKGMALTRYPVESSLPAVGYKVKAFTAGSCYGALLEKWNGGATISGRFSGCWDEFDVTGAVNAALAGEDRKLVLALKVTGGEIEWFGGDAPGGWSTPRLVIRPGAGTPVASAPSSPAAREEPAVTSPVKTNPDSGAAVKPVEVPEKVSSSSPAAGRLTINSVPERADIYVNDKYVGTTPSRELSLPLGEVRVRLEKKGYLKWERVVSLLKGNVLNVAPELEKTQSGDKGTEEGKGLFKE